MDGVLYYSIVVGGEGVPPSEALPLSTEELGLEDARAAFMQGAFEKHHAELCSVARALQQGLSSPPTSIALVDDERRLRRALGEHLPKSALWRDLERWEQLAADFAAGRDALRARAVKETAAAGLEDGYGGAPGREA